ncbi:MAG: hypothetical protein AAB631_02680 [Patescibacteria group bacterium]
MKKSKRALKEGLKKGLRKFFEAAQYLGFDILPRHFYSEIPDIRELKQESTWKNPRTMVGVLGSDMDAQLDFAKSCCNGKAQMLSEENVFLEACRMNGDAGFGPVESDFLFCFLGFARPHKVIQVGAGLSTAVMLQAMKKFDFKCDIICIDPYPTQFLREIAKKISFPCTRRKHRVFLWMYILL